MMRSLATASFVLAAVIAASAQTPPATPRPQVTAIVGATVVNLDDGAPITDAVIVVEGEKIVAVGPALATKIPDGARVIRAAGKWILPGLINLHSHFGLKLPGKQAAELANESEAALALRMAAAGRAALHSGVTTVRMAGDALHADLALKRSIDRGESDGPRIYSAGQPVVVTGGHGARNGEETFDGPDQLRKAVRREIHAGASWIKIMISGGSPTSEAPSARRT